MSLDLEVLIIGAGMSGIGIAVQLTRKYGNVNYEIIEKSIDLGGTWWLNSYPGCGCDVASHFYSYSFALNPNWSKVYSMQPEILAYFRSVAEKYQISPRVRFSSAVQSAKWDKENGAWLVDVEDLLTGRVYRRRCKILISAVGSLSIPQECGIPGVQDYQGRLFHSAHWDHSFNWKGKDVVVIGNGCSATQFVPVISEGEGAVRKVTQFSRQAHWLAKRLNPDYSTLFKWIMRWMPGAMRLYRAYLYWEKEYSFRGFSIINGVKLRDAWAKDATKYIVENAPNRYRKALLPKSVIGCKRRVNDTGYLQCLHRPNVDLIHDDPVKEITKDGVKTTSGKLIKVDAIILATGFQTHRFLFPMDIQGESGKSLNEHWNEVSDGTASAYYGTCYADFPNFFTMMGPNTVTGHLSVIFTVECQIDFTMKLIAPIMKSLKKARSGLPDIVTVTAEAEKADNSWIQEKAKTLVWSTGCTSWFIDVKTGRNTQMYPDWQFLFWARSYWIPWRDFVYRRSAASLRRGGLEKQSAVPKDFGAITAVAALVAGWAVFSGLLFASQTSTLKRLR